MQPVFADWSWRPLQYMHIPERERCNWIRERIETVDPVGAWHLTARARTRWCGQRMDLRGSWASSIVACPRHRYDAACMLRATML